MSTIDLNHTLNAAQRLVEMGSADAALKFLVDNGIKGYKILDGRIVSEKDQTETWLKQFITVDPAMLKVKDCVRKLAKVDDEVLIHGPTGTGKEILAHALHGTRDGNFQALNCAGLPETLVESELFGHVRGAFTGATDNKPGLVLVAKNGTLFLDEIGELPLQAQAKLLRVLQERKIRPVGGNNSYDVTCRFVFATNRNLTEMCDKGLFRTDLYARISVFELMTVSLDLRPNDIPLILKSLDAEALIKHLNPAGLPRLTYPFNVRSLQSIVKRWKVLGEMP